MLKYTPFYKFSDSFITKMNIEDPAYNIKFSQIVEKYPVLWNFNLGGYGKRDVTNQAWQNIADEVDDSVANCRERWRNIRTAFVRSHRHYYSPASKRKRPYYLNRYLHYLYPYAKLSIDPSETITLKYDTSLNNVEIEENTLEGLDVSNIENEVVENISYEDCDENIQIYSQPTEDGGQGEGNIEEHNYVTLSVRKPKRIKIQKNPKVIEYAHDNKTNVIEYTHDNKVNVNAHASSASKDDDNCDLLFLRSLLPDIQKMNNKQKRNFKMYVLEVIDKVLDSSD